MTSDRASRRGRAARAAAIFILALCAAALSDGLVAAAASRAPRMVVALGRFVTGFGTSEYMFAFSALIAATAVVALGRGHATWHGGSLRVVAERALYFFATIAIAGILDQTLKHLVGRARPQLMALEGSLSFHPLSIRDSVASFPSGHTASAFAAAVALGFMWPAWRLRFAGGALLIGLSRILVGAHYPSDVVGGAALGSLAALAVAHGFARRGAAFTLRGDRPVIKPLRPVAASAEPRA